MLTTFQLRNLSMSHQVINLRGKIALITGASSGIGRNTALLFKKLGASLLITGRNSDALDNLAGELQSLRTEGVVHTISADLQVEKDVLNVLASIKNVFNNRLDVLVNSAGVLEMGTIETTSMEQFDRVMNINLRSMYQITMLAVPLLIASKGAIVNVSSVNGIRSFPGVLAYNISKAGVDQLTRCIAIELGSKGVRVNAVNPGVTITEIHRRAGLDEVAYKAFLERSRETHALGRPGLAEEVANAIAFLASDGASNITGVTLPVDGGRHALCPR